MIQMAQHLWHGQRHIGPSLVILLCVNSNFVYVKVRNKSNGKIYVVAETRPSELPIEKTKKGSPNGAVDDNANSKTKGSTSKNTVDAYELLEKFSGASLVYEFVIISSL